MFMAISLSAGGPRGIGADTQPGMPLLLVSGPYRGAGVPPRASRALLGLTRQTVLDGVPDQFDPVVQVQLAARVLHVVLHGAVGQPEPGGDLLVGPAGGDHAEDLGLAFGQPRRVRAVPGAPAAEGPPAAPGAAGGQWRRGGGGAFS